MINVYHKNEKYFDNNGICILNNCLSCTVMEELNGYYGVELEYPITIDKRFMELQDDRVLKVPTPNGGQLFRIFHVKKNINSVFIEARHIVYDLLDHYIESIQPKLRSGTEILQEIMNGTLLKHNFHATTNIQNKLKLCGYTKKSPIACIQGENGFLSLFGGEIARDNFNVNIFNNLGQDKGVTISYGKNLIGIEEDLDTSEVITCVNPTARNEDDSILELPEVYITSPNSTKYANVKIKNVDYSDLKVHHIKTEIIENPTADDPPKPSTEVEVTKEDIFAEMRDRVGELYSIGKIDIPKVNYTVDFMELTKTEEYKNYKILEKIYLGDTVTVKHKILGLDIKVKCIKYTWDSLTNKYIELELGDLKKDLSNSFSSLDTKLEELKNKSIEDKSDIKKIIDETDKRVAKTVENIIKMNNDTEKLREYIDSVTQDIGVFKIETDELLATKVGSEEFASYKTQTADKISSEVTSLNDSLLSYINQTADSINSTVQTLDSNFSTFRSQTYDKFADVVTSSEFRSYREQTASSISSKVSSSDYSSFVYQTDNRLDSVVYKDGSIKTSRISQALEGDTSFIKMIADRIEIKPNSGVIEFPDGQDIDCRADSVRIRYRYNNYIRVGRDGISFYNGSSGANGRAFMNFDEDGVYVHGKRVQWNYA